MGVIARVLDLGPPFDKVVELSPVLEGSTQIRVQTHGRVAIKNFYTESGRVEAEVDQIDEGAMVEAPD